nr:hypothetical protein BHI3_31700 [Bacteriovorax sp. HI3]
MRNLVIGLVLLFTAQTSFASERAFRIDRFFPVVNGYAVAWGVPGQNLDFEWLDTLTYDQIDQHLDISSVRNFVVDIESNKILTVVGANDEERDEFVVFNVGDTHFGNHYNLSLDKLAIQNLGYDTDAIVLTENFKWSNYVSKILLINRETKDLKTVELKGDETMEVLRKKLRESILPKNIKLFDDASENVTFNETKFLENVGDVNVITFDYSYPKSMENALEVVATVKMKYENGKVIPYILSVKQKQY